MIHNISLPIYNYISNTNSVPLGSTSAFSIQKKYGNYNALTTFINLLCYIRSFALAQTDWVLEDATDQDLSVYQLSVTVPALYTPNFADSSTVVTLARASNNVLPTIVPGTLLFTSKLITK